MKFLLPMTAMKKTQVPKGNKTKCTRLLITLNTLNNGKSGFWLRLDI